MPQHSSHPGAFVSSGVIKHLGGQLRPRRDEQADWIVGSFREASIPDFDSGKSSERIIDGIVFKGQNAVKKHLPSGHIAPPVHLDQRTVVVLQKVNLALLERSHPRDKLGVRSNRDPDRQSIDEQTNHRVDAGQRARPARNGHSPQYVLLSAVAT